MEESVTLFLCGDVMTGRGIDQVLPRPCPPQLHEPWVTDARDYVALAEAANGPIPRPMGFADIWGDALAELDQVGPDLRLINLETSITRSDTPWPGKGIHYRMSPENAHCLRAAGIDACALANNHVLDWGHGGLRDTLAVLDELGIAHAGAGTVDTATEPARLAPGGRGRVLFWSIGVADSGIPESWQVGEQAGVWWLPEASGASVDTLARRLREHRQPGDLVVVSVHWGGNWGYGVASGHRAFARRLIDAGADVIHGHSSHHPRGMELYRGRPVLYGCGDFLNDYEGIGGHEIFRPELTLMVFCRLAQTSGELRAFWLTPMRIRRFSLHRASMEEARWMRDTLNRERIGDSPELRLDSRGRLHWPLQAA